MNIKNLDSKTVFIGISIIIAYSVAALLLGNALVSFKKLDRSVVVKGLSEREYPADTVLWPIGFSQTSNNLTELYNGIDSKKTLITNFLINKGIDPNHISIAPPRVVDRQSLTYNDGVGEFRYIAKQYITVYSTNTTLTRQLMAQLPELGKQNIVFVDNNYENPIVYSFSKFNIVKPEMIEESTKDARIAAIKFAKDSESKLGKIKKASQGLFTINQRDSNNPHIKVIRVVSTIEYHLVD